VEKWAIRMHRIFSTLNPKIVEYKGLVRYLPLLVDYFAPFDDGRVLTAGTAPEQTSV